MALDHDHTDATTLWGTPANRPQLAGSVYVNNTSYSGCDIKILLKMHPNRSFADLGKDSKPVKNIQRDESEIKRVESEMSRLEALVEKLKPGSQERIRIDAQYVKLANLHYHLRDALEGSAEVLTKKAQAQTSQRGNGSTKVLAEAQTLSFSSFRDKRPVLRCGTTYPAGFTRGPRMLSGSLIFTVFDRHVLYSFLEADPSDFDGVKYTSAVMDQIPPVDILISFANEYGAVSRMDIYGVEFQGEGLVMSIEDMLLEQTVGFMARDWDPMRAVSKRNIDQVSNQMQKQFAKTGSDLLYEEDFLKVKGATNPFTRFSRRRNPFL